MYIVQATKNWVEDIFVPILLSSFVISFIYLSIGLLSIYVFMYLLEWWILDWSINLLTDWLPNWLVS